MSGSGGSGDWRFVKFGLLVTGRGEMEFLPDFFRAVMQTGQCSFQVIGRIQQLAPVSSSQRKAEMVGKRGQVFDKNEQMIGAVARRFIQEDADHFVLVIDDLEADHRNRAGEKFERYRRPLDALLGKNRWRAAVHFLRNMLEAYYLAHAQAVNDVLGTNLADYPEDVEDIQHPKGELKSQAPNYREVEHGAKIVHRLELDHVLSRPETCASLRSLVAWCYQAQGLPTGNRFCMDVGAYFMITGRQRVNPEAPRPSPSRQ